MPPQAQCNTPVNHDAGAGLRYGVLEVFTRMCNPGNPAAGVVRWHRGGVVTLAPKKVPADDVS